jgi:two-component system nitrogen regulation response regulator GlnG/two-component system response regulator HydG
VTTSATTNPTVPEDDLCEHPFAQGAESESVPTLVITYCPSEPWRIGESAILPIAGSGKRVLLGRGSPKLDDPCERLVLARYVNGNIEAGLPIGAPGLSRQQALLSVAPDGTIEVHNVGKCPLLCNGIQTTAARATTGDVIQFGKQLLLLCVKRSRQTPTKEHYPKHEYGAADEFGIVGESPAAVRVRQSIAFMAPRSEHVLIQGASGTGKELVARAIHRLSPRREQILVSRNAATIPEGLIDAELFGNIKNYPHSGMPARPGLVGEAHGSSLFLDEFAELPPSMQVHLLRVLDSGEYQRLGEVAVQTSDFRLIAATNRPLPQIKEDLLARFSLRVHVPDLNARREDIPWLVRHVLKRIASSDPMLSERLFPKGDLSGEPAVTIGFSRQLLRHEYRTNVRELEMIILASIEQSEGGALVWPARVERANAKGAEPTSPPPEFVNATPREHLQAVLDRHNGRIEGAWRELGLKNRYALRRLIGKYGLELRRRPS